MGSFSRRVLYALATSDRAEALIRSQAWLEKIAYRAARRYVAGSSLEDALATVDGLHREGLAASLDLFGESVTEVEAVERAVQGYLEAAAAINELQADIYLEVVPSHIGIDVSTDFCRGQAERIVEALPAGVRLEVSAEESWRTDRILDLVLGLGRDGAPVMPTLQANLRRSPDDATRLIEAGIPVRLVKGAYVEPAETAHPWGEETDVAFMQLAHDVHHGGVELAIGTHDAVMRESLLLALPGIRVEMLLGIRAADARDLVRRGHHVRIYVPYGQAWFRYWMRRVAESRGA